MKLIQLGEGRYMNIDPITEIRTTDRTNWPEHPLQVHFDSENTAILHFVEADKLLAVLNAPVQVSAFVGSNELIRDAIWEAERYANKFLASLQPWKIIAINSQTVIKANDYGSTYNHVITITYRDYRDLSPARTEEAA